MLQQDPVSGLLGGSDTLNEIDPNTLAASAGGKVVAKRPFLKRGSRMPISKLPDDPFTPVVKPIKNPPTTRPTNVSSLEPHDLDRVRGKDLSDSEVTSVTSRKSPALAAPQTRGGQTDDLEVFLRDVSSISPSVQEHLATGPPSSHSYISNRISSAVVPRPSSRASVRDTMTSELLPRPTTGRSRYTRPTSEVSQRFNDTEIELEMKKKLQELDEQINKFKKENEYCKKLRLEREAALAEAQRTRERALAELEAAEKDIQNQRAQLNQERKRMHQDKDRGKGLSTQLRELAEENKVLKEKLVETESSLGEKISKLKSEIVRLSGTVSDLMQAKAELEAARSTMKVNAALEDSPVANSYTHPDGRIDRVYVDGRREAVFPSGMRKTVWPDGAALVRFPNGDVKETAASGVVKYQYASTGCVQTTQPDGVEILQFPSGQIETHFPNGTKEIKFPSGIVKRIDAAGNDLPTRSFS